MDELYPEPSEELIGKRIQILHNVGMISLSPGQIVTVTDYKSGALALLELDGNYWACSLNPNIRCFIVVGDASDNELMEDMEPDMSPLMKSIFYNLNRLAIKITKHEQRPIS
jgi:hypothetical protein